DEIRQRLARRTPLDQRIEATRRIHVERALGKRDHGASRRPRRVSDEKLRVELRRIADRLEARRRLPHELTAAERIGARRLAPDHPLPPPSARSCSARYSLMSGAITSSSSPSRIGSSLCSVRSMRWTVTRPRGKLYVRMRSERSPVPTRLLRRAAVSLSRFWISASRSFAASSDSARALFLCCERSSWHSTTMPVGKC